MNFLSLQLAPSIDCSIFGGECRFHGLLDFSKDPPMYLYHYKRGLVFFQIAYNKSKKLDLIPQNKLATTVKHFHHYVTHVYNGWRKNVALELCYYMENSLLVDVVHALLYHIVEHQKYFQAIYMGHQG